jgi:hypothetical protein
MNQNIFIDIAVFNHSIDIDKTSLLIVEDKEALRPSLAMTCMKHGIPLSVFLPRRGSIAF